MGWPTLPAEAWFAVAGICALMVLLSLSLVAGRLDYEIRLHQLRVESRRLRAEYARRLFVSEQADPSAAGASRRSGAATKAAA